MLLFVTPLFAQDKHYKDFVQLLNNSDTATIASYIKKWENEKGKTADVYAAWFNYYILKKRSEPILFTSSQPKGESLAVVDSTGNAVAYFGDLGMHSVNLNLAINTINEGIQKFPDRADLAFGKTRILFSSGEYDMALKELHRVLDRSVENNNKWKWSSDVSIPDGMKMLTETFHGYFSELYNEKLDSVAMVLVDDVLAHYPENVYFLNNKSALLSVNGKDKEALAILEKIHGIDPSDEIVIINIAFLNKKFGNKKEAKKILQKTAWKQKRGIEISRGGSVERFIINKNEEALKSFLVFFIEC